MTDFDTSASCVTNGGYLDRKLCLTCRIPAEWSELWTPRPAARRRPSASCTSSGVCTLPGKSIRDIRDYIQEKILKAPCSRWCTNSPTRPARPSQPCPSSAETLHPGHHSTRQQNQRYNQSHTCTPLLHVCRLQMLPTAASISSRSEEGKQGTVQTYRNPGGHVSAWLFVFVC